MKRTLSTLLIIVMLTGCVSLKPSDRGFLKELEGYGVTSEEYAIKKPGLAGALNFLPGIGNFYLAVGSGQPEQWALGLLNLLVWPYSIVWGVPGAAIDAITINKKATVDYYRYDPKGKEAYANMIAVTKE